MPSAFPVDQFPAAAAVPQPVAAACAAPLGIIEDRKRMDSWRYAISARAKVYNCGTKSSSARRYLVEKLFKQAAQLKRPPFAAIR
jgi:hypothetical protein